MILPPCKRPQEAQFARDRVQRNNMAGSSLRIYQLKAQKADNFEYLCPRKKTTILMCKMEGQFCFQNTGPKVESQWEVNFRVFPRAGCKQARMCWMVLKKMSFNSKQPRLKKRKQTDSLSKILHVNQMKI